MSRLPVASRRGRVTVCGTLTVEAPSVTVAYGLLVRLGLRSEVETHGLDASITLRVSFASDDELRKLLARVQDAMGELDVGSLRLSIGERAITLEQ